MIVNSTARTPGRNSGHTWLLRSADAVRASGLPPAADTRQRPLDPDVQKTVVSSGPQLAPRMLAPGTSQIVTTGPPTIGTFMSLLTPSSEKPSHALSGDTNGFSASGGSVGSDVAISVSSGRTCHW